MENKFDELKFVDVEEITYFPEMYARITYKNGMIEDLTKEEFEKLEFGKKDRQNVNR